MQPVCLSSTTSLITPTSEPSAERIFEPMILLLGKYSVVVEVVVDWVCALAGATARPTAANVAPNSSDVFIACLKTDETPHAVIQPTCRVNLKTA